MASCPGTGRWCIPFGVDGIRLRQRSDEPDGCVDLLGCIEAVIHNRLREDRDEHEAGMLGLILRRRPDDAAPADRQRKRGLAARRAGIRDEHDHRICVFRAVVLRNEQLILHLKARLGVGEGQQLILVLHLFEDGLQRPAPSSPAGVSFSASPGAASRHSASRHARILFIIHIASSRLRCIRQI